MPATLVTATEKVCIASDRPLYAIGEVQLVAAAASSAHLKVAPAPALGEWNVKVAVVACTEPVGPLSITVSGVDVSIVHVYVAGVASTLPAGSVARTENVCEPSVSAVSRSGVVHAVHAPVSTMHSNVEPSSVAVKSNSTFTELSTVGGFLVIVVSGGVRSTVHDAVAGVRSTLPARSVAATENVCAPSATGISNGDVHGCAVAPSIAHANVELSSVEVNSKCAVALLVSAGGCAVIVVSGAVVFRNLGVELVGVCAARVREVRPTLTARGDPDEPDEQKAMEVRHAEPPALYYA